MFDCIIRVLAADQRGRRDEGRTVPLYPDGLGVKPAGSWARLGRCSKDMDKKRKAHPKHLLNGPKFDQTEVAELGRIPMFWPGGRRDQTCWSSCPLRDLMLHRKLWLSPNCGDVFVSKSVAVFYAAQRDICSPSPYFCPLQKCSEV